MSNEIVKNEEKNIVAFGENANMGNVLAEELDGLNLSFDRIKIPSGGGLAFEVPGDDPDSPDTVKEFKAVILYHHPISCFYKEEYKGGNNPPDCGSMDGKIGILAESGELRTCADCPNNKFGSAKNGGKACKQKRRMYLLRENESLPILLSLPTGSLAEFSKYVMRLLSRGKKPNRVVTKFSLKKVQNAGGISYSQAVFSFDRDLTEAELNNVLSMSDQVKNMATKVEALDEE